MSRDFVDAKRGGVTRCALGRSSKGGWVLTGWIFLGIALTLVRLGRTAFGSRGAAGRPGPAPVSAEDLVARPRRRSDRRQAVESPQDGDRQVREKEKK